MTYVTWCKYIIVIYLKRIEHTIILILPTKWETFLNTIVPHILKFANPFVPHICEMIIIVFKCLDGYWLNFNHGDDNNDMLKINKNLFPYVLRYKNSSKSVRNLCKENKKILGCYKKPQWGTCDVDQIGN
jgi:hypothetical protein